MSSLSLSNGLLASACPLQPRRRRLPATISSSSSSSNNSKESNNTNSNEPNNNNGLVMDRRGVLLGLGGLYGSTAKLALSAPLVPPDFKTCHQATAPGLSGNDVQCCPPKDYANLTMKDYTFPTTPLRVRRAAQNVANDKSFLAKYNNAVSMMKSLPDDHPWNFLQQAKIHCANCDYALYQTGYDGKVNLQVHNSWIFTAWHRYYLYFYERILGKLIGDDTFALPYWNWDSQDGMHFPQIFRDPNSALYDANRDPTHIPPSPTAQTGIVNYTGSEQSGQALVDANLSVVRSAFRESLNNAALFMGDPIEAGDPATDYNGSGTLQRIHDLIHLWVGTTGTGNIDMGNFATAARDSVFFCHHSNVDRLWNVFDTLRGNKPDFPDSDWLDSSFAFVDENQDLVQVKVKDALSIDKLGYAYETVPIPWLGKVSRRKKAAAETKPKVPANLVPVPEFGPMPRDLDSTVRVLVPRPKTNRSSEEKEEQLEVLFITGIQINTPGTARFDVFIAKPYNGNQAGPDLGQYVGSFTRLSHRMVEAATGMRMRKGSQLLGITFAITDIGADDAANLVVSFRPRNGKISVGGVELKLVDTDTN